ncbi:MAG: hypothetical protein ABI833_19745, partial [Acidobacteriota bacterium]
MYRRLVHNVDDWWSPQHTFSGDAHNLTLEEKPMGCFCEMLPGQGGVRHMEVLRFAPGKELVLSGALGPLQSLAATGSMTIQLSASEAGTNLEVTYAVAGYLPGCANRPRASRTASAGSEIEAATSNTSNVARTQTPLA